MSHFCSDDDLLKKYLQAVHRFCDLPRQEHMMLPMPQGSELTSHQSNALMQEIIRPAMEVMREEERPTSAERDWDPSEWVYSMIPQVHTGGRRGMGGRSTIDVRRHFKSLLSSVISSTLVELDSKSDLHLRDFFDDVAVAKLKDIHSQGLANLYKNYFGLLPGNLLGVYAKFSYRDTPTVSQEIEKNNIANSRDRHLLCTWLDRQGNVRCSCIGKTLFTAKSNMKQFSIPCCVHAMDAYAFFESLMPNGTTNRAKQIHDALSSISLAIKDARSIPLPFEGHKGASLLLPKEYAEFGSCGEQWVPIRTNRKRSNLLICAFCDMRSENNCEHIKEWKRTRELGLYQGCSQENDPNKGFDIKLVEENTDRGDVGVDDYLEERLGRSHLPIAPINCPKSVQVDRAFGDLVRPIGESTSGSSVFLVQAPLRCLKCDMERDENSRKEMGEGIISCTMGQVRIQVESFQCSNSNCGALIYEEGRSQHIVFYSFSSAATHAFKRRDPGEP